MPGSSLIALSVLAAILIGVIFYVVFWPGIRIRRIVATPFPESWATIVNRRLPFTKSLPDEQRQRLEDLIKFFIADKNFIGCAGQEIDDDIRVTIAAQACLLIMNRPEMHYQKLRSILVYPSTFVATREIRDDLGLVSVQHHTLLGESWDMGKVVLAWDNVESGVLNLHDGHNVVLHEFAHQLDSESGSTNGAPVLRTRGAYKSWAQIFQLEFERLRKPQFQHKQSLLDEYGATNPAEFFAVATETFFEEGKAMRSHHRELYDELVSFYRLDPAKWHT